MGKKYRFFLVDDDPNIIELFSTVLETDGHMVFRNTSSVAALPQIIAKKPDCVLLDIMMPEIDGFELCKRLKAEQSLDRMKIVMVSGKTYEYDRQHALALGADDFITKPVEVTKLLGRLERIIEDWIELNYWGVRGTIPVPGEKTLKYGGNTSCISLEFTRGNFFIFDAGTGIMLLSEHLMARERSRIEAKIFISHPHWDHINALPFFTPLYMQGNEFEICGPSQNEVKMRELISAQMDGMFFPIRIKELGSRTYFNDLTEEQFEIDGIKIQTMLLNHPGHCLGYRVTYKDRSICYVTDNEIYPKSSRFFNENYNDKLKKFALNADILITDCTYSDKEYETKIGWGHSSISEVAGLADRARVKHLHLFHHDPEQTDDDIDSKLESMHEMLVNGKSKTECMAPKEKQRFFV